MNSPKPTTSELRTASMMRAKIAMSLAEALQESGQLSALENGLTALGIHLNLPSKPTVSETAAALETMLDRNPELIPWKKFFQLPVETRTEWATDLLNSATAGAGDFQ